MKNLDEICNLCNDYRESVLGVIKEINRFHTNDRYLVDRYIELNNTARRMWMIVFIARHVDWIKPTVLSSIRGYVLDSVEALEITFRNFDSAPECMERLKAFYEACESVISSDQTCKEE